MDLSETINHARTAKDVPPTPSDDYGLIEDPIENQGRDPPTFFNCYNSFLAPLLYVVREKGGGRRGDSVCCGEPGGWKWANPVLEEEL